MNLYYIRCHPADWSELLTLGQKLGAGHPDETLSAAAWRTAQDGKPLGVVMRPVIDLIFLAFERQHCKTAFESELNRKHLPAEYRQV